MPSFIFPQIMRERTVQAVSEGTCTKKGDLIQQGKSQQSLSARSKENTKPKWEDLGQSHPHLDHHFRE